MKNKINKVKLSNLSLKIPYILILLLIIGFCPLGVYLLVLRTYNKKNNMYNKGRMLISIGLFIGFLLGVGIYSEVKEIIQLYDSGMSLDMMNFVPKYLGVYVVGIVMIVFFVLGGKKLIKRAKTEQIYTTLINLERTNNVSRISKFIGITNNEVKNNIKLLQTSDHLIPIKVTNNNIVYLEDEHYDVITKSKCKRKICNHCGNIVTFKVDVYTECDFCGNGIIDEK